jgi:multiple sugar transport system substrate-binding protein
MKAGMTRRGLVNRVVLGLPLVAAAGCARGQDDGAPNAPPVTQGVVIRFGAKDSAPDSLAELELLAKEDFEPAFPGARVEIEPLTGGYFEKLQAAFAAGTAPETARFDEYYIPFLVGKNAILPMDQYAARDKQFDSRGLFPIPWQAGHYQGKFYGLTTSPNTYILVYNRTAFEQAGLKPPPSDYRDKTWTWNRMREDARRLVKPGGTPDNTRFAFMWDATLFSRFSALVRANAGKIVDRDEDPRKGALDDAKTVELLQLLQDMRHRDRTAPMDADMKGRGIPALIANDQLAMGTSLANVGNAFKDVPFDWDVAPLPRANSNGQASTTLITNVYGMFGPARNPELAWAWVRIAGGAKHGLWQVQKKDFIPGWKSLRDEYLKLPPAHRQAALDTADYGLPSITTPRYLEVQDLVREGLDPVWQGTAPAMQAVDQLMPKLNDLLRAAG